VSDLPANWSLATLAGCCDIIQGQSPPGETYNTNGKGLPFFQGKAEFGEMHPIARKWCTAPTKIAEPGDILISIRAPVGPTNVATERCCIGRGLAAIRPRPGIEGRYVLYAVRHSTRALVAKATGSTFEAVSGSDLAKHVLPIAPLAEQRRIVAEIEEQFTRLDAAEDALRRTLARSGHLLDASAERRIVQSGYPLRSLGDLCDVQGGIQKQPSRLPREHAYPFLRVANVLRGKLWLNEVHEIELFEGELERLRLMKGDLLIVEGNGSPRQIGRMAVWDGSIDPCVHQNHIIRARPRPGVLHSGVLEFTERAENRERNSKLY